MKIDVVTEVQDLNANEETSKRAETSESQFIADQYAVSSWFRWVDNLDVGEPVVFQLFNLGANEVRKPERGEIGDRALEIHLLHAGHNKMSVLFNTYTI